LGLVERLELRRRLPLLVGQIAEGLLHPAKLDLKDTDGVLVRAHRLLPALDPPLIAF
jgi:hypothetical protein